MGNFNTYLEDIYRLAFWVVGIAVVFMLTVGGFMYLTSAGNTARMESAKTVIFDAILGLILALVAWLFLYVINPDLINVTLPMVGVTPPSPQLPPPSIPPSTPPGGTAWPSDASERAALPSSVTVNKANCTTLGQPDCTSLAGSTAIAAIQALNAACGSCAMVITGGTECWLHGSKDTRCNGTHHKPGDDAIDIRHSTVVDNYIQSRGSILCSLGGRPLYQLDGAVFWNESDHWHVNFNHTTCGSI